MTSKVALDLVVEDEHEGTTGSSDNVGEGALEEGLATLILVDFLEAVNCAGIKNITSARLHHKSSSDGVKRIRSNTSAHCDELSESPHGEDVSFLGVREEHGLASIEHTEI